MNNLFPEQGYTYPQSGVIASPPDQASVAASAYSANQLSQSKRQNSMSAYNNHPSLKRTANPLQLQFLMQSNVPAAQAFPSSASPARFASAASSRRNVRKSGQFLAGQTIKTPTPTSYDIPLSPGANVAALQNNLDLSGSSPMVDQQVSSAGLNKDSVARLPDSLLNQNLNSLHPLHPGNQFVQPLHQQQSLQQPLQPPQRTMSDEEQQLATKLKETYKNIVNFEEVVQKSCIELTIKINQSNFTSLGSPYASSMYGQQQSQHLPGSPALLQSSVSTSSTELSNNLWTIYHHNLTLLNNYYDFLITALKPTANSTQFKTGKNIVDLYKIPRRMWVYGIVGFLEVLKNIMSIFLDHEIYLCFIAHCFSIVSNLTDPALEMEGWWCEKLGDLSRMAIALYSSRFIDWKISAEYWYSVAMKTMYGHGKIYYHICTVQQDNLDALVNIGKSVVCRDPFVPTQQYLRLVVENICTQRNILSLLELPIIDFIKIHKVLLTIHNSSPNVNEAPHQTENIHDSQLQYGIELVTRYGLNFGCDSHGFNFFTGTFCVPGAAHNKYGADPFNQYLKQQHEQDQQTNTLDTLEKMNFWFNKGSLFAIANVNHLIGFGDPKNPFAKIFQLPEALKERKDKKDKKRKSRSLGSQEDATELGAGISNINGAEGQFLVASELSVTDWFYCLTYINKSVLELSFRILNHYLIGPKLVSTCHVLVWLYFLIAVGEASNKYPNSKSMFLWLFRKFFPWESLINYLNTLVAVAINSPHLSSMCRDYLINHLDYLQFFNEHEFLPEIWKCWGTLWFDVISAKQDYSDFNSAGVLSHSLFDLPICGTSPVINIHGNNASSRGKSKSRDQQEHDNDERLVRIILLARILADKYDFGIVRTLEGFKYDEKINSENETDYLLTLAAPTMTNELFAFIREVVYGDSRLVQDNFVVPISPGNLVNPEHWNMISAEDKDDHWFKIRENTKWNHTYDADLEEEMHEDDEDLAAYADSEFDEAEPDYQQQLQSQTSNQARHLQNHHFYHQLQHPQAIIDNDPQKFDEFYADNYVASDILPVIGNTDIQIEGDLGDRMDSSLTYITLDTNIWLKHCGRVFKCVRNGVFKVLIPLIVFQELRSLRKSAEATIADAATRSVIIIRELYLAREIVPLRFDGTVASDINETTEFENNSNWMSNVDLTILNVVNEHDEISKKLLKGLHCTINGHTQITLDSKYAKMFRYCILITDDRNMRLRAKTSGLTSYQSKWLFGQLEEIFPDKCID